MELDGKIALVTGAARRVGRAIALELAHAGADLAIHCHHSKDDAESLVTEIRTLGRQAECFSADLADPAEIATMFELIGNRFARLEVLVNNASVYHRTPWAEFTAEQWDAEFAVNTRGAALCIQHALKLFGDRPAAVVNIADIGAEKARPSYPAYCASKAALLAMTVSAARAMAPQVRVNAISPGVALWADPDDEQEHQKVLAQIPMKRPGSPEDIAKAVRFVIENDYLTAQNLRVDGGWSMG